MVGTLPESCKGAAPRPETDVGQSGAQIPTRPLSCRVGSSGVDSGMWTALLGCDLGRQRSAEHQTLPTPAGVKETLVLATSPLWGSLGGAGHTPSLHSTHTSMDMGNPRFLRQTDEAQKLNSAPREGVRGDGAKAGAGDQARGRAQGSDHGQTECSQPPTDGQTRTLTHRTSAHPTLLQA